MGYYTGTATNHADLFSKVRAHATLEGWVCSLDAGYNIFTKEGLTVKLQENISGTGYVTLGARISTDGTGTLNVGTMTEKLYTDFNLRYTDPIISYHAFIDTGTTPSIYLAIEILPSIWRNIQFGILEKVGGSAAWVGGAFLFGHHLISYADWDYFNNSALGLPPDSLSYDEESGGISYTDDDAALVWGQYANFLGTSYLTPPQTTRYSQTTGFGLSLARAGSVSDTMVVSTKQPNAATGESVIVPIDGYGIRSDGLYSRLGRLPNVALVNVTGHPDASTVTIGAGTWRIFPVRAAGLVIDTGLVEETGTFGYAYKQ